MDDIVEICNEAISIINDVCDAKTADDFVAVNNRLLDFIED